MTEVLSGAVTGTGSGSLGGVDTSFTIKDAVTVYLTFQPDLDLSGTVVQNGDNQSYSRWQNFEQHVYKEPHLRRFRKG
jgi:hypothetical protein